MAWFMLNVSLAVLASISALLFGETSEKRGGYIILIMVVLALAGHHIFPEQYKTVDVMSLVADIFAFIGFSLIGIYSKRIWPLWAASLQLLSVGAHFVRALEMPVRPIVYAWMKSGPTWGVILLLIIGTITSYQRRRSPTSARSSRS